MSLNYRDVILSPPPRGREGVAASAAGGVGGRAKRVGMNEDRTHGTALYVFQILFKKTVSTLNYAVFPASFQKSKNSAPDRAANAAHAKRGEIYLFFGFREDTQNRPPVFNSHLNIHPIGVIFIIFLPLHKTSLIMRSSGNGSSVQRSK